MSTYYVSKYPNEKGKHEVHKKLCEHKPPPESLIELGDFQICSDAILKARTIYPEVNGCYFCCFPCHKK